MTPKKQPPIAIVGVSALFPGSPHSEGFWKDILSGADLLTDIPETHWLPEDYYDVDPTAPDKTYAKRGGFLPKIDFDALHWGVPPSIIEATDTSQLLALILAERVLRDAANGQFDTMDRSRISCILGVTSAQELLGTIEEIICIEMEFLWKQWSRAAVAGPSLGFWRDLAPLGLLSDCGCPR